MTARLPSSTLATLLLSLGLVGCGDDGGSASATEPDTTTTGSTGTTADASTSTTGSPTTTSTTDAPTTGTTTAATSDASTTAATGTDGTTDGDSTTTGVDTTTTGTTAVDTDTSTSDGSTSTGAVETCMDGAQNQDETDIDCGGAICSPCGLGQACSQQTDCIEGACLEGTCTMVECLVDADCDGMDGECAEGVCDPNTFTCTTAPTNEGGACDDGDLCSTSSTCSAGSCVAAELVDCSALDGACTLGTCDPQDGQCDAAPANEGQACDDGKACTVGTTCAAGVCGDPNDPGYVFYEDFSDNSAGWALSSNWAIGAAVAGCGDPGLDHTATADNGIAGVVLGGCAPTAPVDANNFFCLTSPAVDTTGLPTVSLGFWRDLWSDYTPYMKNKIEVWNGNAWNVVFETFGAPEVNDAAWQKFTYDITKHSNAALQVRWCYNIGSAGAFNRGQWNVDDVVIAPVACDP